MRSRTARGANISALYHWTLGAVRLSPPLWQAPKSGQTCGIITLDAHILARKITQGMRHPIGELCQASSEASPAFFGPSHAAARLPVSGATLIEYRPRPRRNDLRHRLNAGSRRPDQSSRRGSERVVREHMQHSASAGPQNDAHVPR